MNRRWAQTTLFVSLLVAPLTASAQAAPGSSGEAWYKIVTGIIAIPAAIVGLIVALNTIRKTSLESKKLELEIREKQGVVATTAESETMRTLAHPVGESQRAILLVLRFVLLELSLRIWNIVPSAVLLLTGTIPAAWILMYPSGIEKLNPRSALMMAIFLVPKVISILLDVVYWVIVFGFGWPLFKDTCRYFKIPIGSLFDVPFISRWKDRSA